MLFLNMVCLTVVLAQRDVRLPDETLEQQIGRIVGSVAPSMMLTGCSEAGRFHDHMDDQWMARQGLLREYPSCDCPQPGWPGGSHPLRDFEFEGRPTVSLAILDSEMVCMGVEQGVAMESLKFHPGPTFLRPANGPPQGCPAHRAGGLRPSSTPLDTRCRKLMMV
jgi:hypothetical protein